MQKNNRASRTRINKDIRVREVRLIDQEGNQRGIVPTHEAARLASDSGLDLVEVQPMAKPPVCKIMDYGKFKYEQKQKAREAKRKQTTVELKEMKFRPKIDTNDFNIKVSKMRKFLEAGNRCRAVIMFKGREMAHTELGKQLLDRVFDSLEGLAQIESPARLEGRNMSMVLSPMKR